MKNKRSLTMGKNIVYIGTVIHTLPNEAIVRIEKKLKMPDIQSKWEREYKGTGFPTGKTTRLDYSVTEGDVVVIIGASGDTNKKIPLGYDHCFQRKARFVLGL
jgi:hypothetical protein